MGGIVVDFEQLSSDTHTALQIVDDVYESAGVDCADVDVTRCFYYGDNCDLLYSDACALPGLTFAVVPPPESYFSTGSTANTEPFQTISGFTSLLDDDDDDGRSPSSSGDSSGDSSSSSDASLVTTAVAALAAAAGLLLG